MTGIKRLLGIMAQLRHPQQGCPWDKEQTFKTIAPYTLEETYEVIDAIERGDFSDLKEELGDLLFQVVFYAEMGKEQQLFDFDDICNAISDKLERRHPHIFGQQQDISSDVAISGWEKRKAQERAQKDLHSVLDDIPASLPALMKAYKIQKRCAAVGFDWDTLGPVLDKVYEEIDEVMDEAHQAVVDQQHLEEEIGDLLFAVVNLSRHLGYKPEIALQKACNKFENRFREIEKLILKQGHTLEAATLEEMEKMWQQVKKQ
ncbi:nucleoside triphosphate pyrophosphohydrolase [Photorhabdus laumondii subsp. laumondii]|uniref:Nucleoside triphosphate pyrophosphohydrolase n=2 Tax=Photorhabdus laumondii subsp. laumondii TaxID=141679 RepID=Q7N837_PHOLL|nr:MULTISPECIES: nucleoside triphosphate pyrophosphohydrolase [Photorhabdus]PQQ36988.1 nucleoside triphosphate pyrophosphohydrolase [Photorhabdus luminescens]AWK40844.1 nucleoside triphosphate pyrophosphohydrolase [Photorhabdus laumondii subsp. laumondii]AXG41652.1 nucleoside triphosphate pyrophosphohydrolase [Photorhabdus laumondii subsp. laumondii]AXG46177.1 nucleoside triphosphate pyrophosphohydrolase [Photorhabdus laumondii subsp. laumondii]KTL61954.1 nucleoside triphosphate hydrolase [Pho